MEVIKSLPVLGCLNPKCLYQWRPRLNVVQRCPKCHQSSWRLVAPVKGGK